MIQARDFSDYLNDMREYAEKAYGFIEGIDLNAFQRDEKVQLAVVRALEIVGEASKKIPRHFQLQHPQIPWRDVAAMRDILVHDYFGVDPQVVWRTVVEDVPPLLEALRALGGNPKAQ